MNHKEKIEWMISYCHKNKVCLELEGECGFGRECVGIIVDTVGYPDYEWYDSETYNRLDNNEEIWIPKDAYHKHPCVAVLGRGEEAEGQLYDWLKWFEDNNFKIEIGDNDLKEYKDLGLLGVLMVKHKYARMIKNN